MKWAGGGIISTVEDLARFAIALDEGLLLKSATLETMYEPMTLADGSRTDYGLGWDSQVDEKGRRWIAHGGGATGGSTYILRLPEKRFAVTIAANVQDAGDRRALGDEDRGARPHPLETGKNARTPRKPRRKGNFNPSLRLQFALRDFAFFFSRADSTAALDPSSSGSERRVRKLRPRSPRITPESA